MKNLFKSDTKFVQKWREDRKIGFRKYAFSHGLAFGILMYVWLLVYFLFFAEENLSFLSKQNLYLFAINILGGFFLFGPLNWYSNQYFYKKLTKNIPSDEAI